MWLAAITGEVEARVGAEVGVHVALVVVVHRPSEGGPGLPHAEHAVLLLTSNGGELNPGLRVQDSEVDPEEGQGGGPGPVGG